jgi:DNA-binding MarR family transcriptional regulator
MSLIRVQHDKNNPYVVVNKSILFNNEISGLAKTIYFYAFSRPDDWTFYFNEIEKHMKEKKKSIRKALKELENFGYLVRKPKQKENGRFDGFEWIFYETPKQKEDFQKISPKCPKRESPQKGKSLKEPLLSKEEEQSNESKHVRDDLFQRNVIHYHMQSESLARQWLFAIGVDKRAADLIFKKRSLEELYLSVIHLMSLENVKSPEKYLVEIVKNRYYRSKKVTRERN